MEFKSYELRPKTSKICKIWDCPKFCHKYATINSYYSIFHAARALLYSQGYRERSHHCLSIAIEALFVETGTISSRYIQIFKNSMSLRENADYSSSFSYESALLSITNAHEFLSAARSLLRE